MKSNDPSNWRIHTEARGGTERFCQAANIFSVSAMALSVQCPSLVEFCNPSGGV